jgi:hypothetical protein
MVNQVLSIRENRKAIDRYNMQADRLSPSLSNVPWNEVRRQS